MGFISKIPAKGLWLILTAFAVIAALAVVMITTSHEKSNPLTKAELSPIEKVAPSGTSSLFLTPATQDWWGFVTAMAPSEYYVKGLNFTESGVQPERFGYVSSINTSEEAKSGGPVKIIYVETKTADDANKFAEWILSKKNAYSTMGFMVKDNIVAITQGWAANDESVFPAETLASNDSYTTDTKVASRDNTIGFAYLDMGKSTASLEQTKDPAVAKKLDEFFKLQFGLDIHKGSWVGHAAGPNTLWVGETNNINIDSNGIDTAKAKELLASFKKIQMQTPEYSISEENESVLFSALLLSIKDKSSDEDKKNFNETFAAYNEVFSKAGFDENNSIFRGAVQTSPLEYVLSGLPQKDSGMKGVVFAAKNGEMAFGFIRNVQ